jgi:lipid-A-disaccharide synthase-like uncharacterized protein
MTDEQRPICSGVVARPIRQADAFALGMRFLRQPSAEIKRRFEEEKAHGSSIAAPWKKLVGHADLAESLPLMKSFQFLAETHLFGILIHPWKIVGLTGSLVFGLRFLIQWIASERARKSVIPFGFWECSALGSLLMLSYFAIYQRDSVGVLSTAMPLPIYLRNLYFRYTHAAPQHPGNAPRPPE